MVARVTFIVTFIRHGPALLRSDASDDLESCRRLLDSLIYKDCPFEYFSHGVFDTWSLRYEGIMENVLISLNVEQCLLK